MKTRNALITALALGLGLAAPAFAQDASTGMDQTPQTTSPADPAAQAQPTPATDPATAQTQPQTSPADPAAQPQEPKQVTWADLDTDQDGNLSKAEAAPVQALSQVFDDADTDKDGALTPDEYKAFVAQNQSDAASQPPGGDD